MADGLLEGVTCRGLLLDRGFVSAPWATGYAQRGIRVNAVGPSSTVAGAGAALASEPDIAALALYLASRPGRTLTGQVFDAAGVARRGC